MMNVYKPILILAAAAVCCAQDPAPLPAPAPVAVPVPIPPVPPTNFAVPIPPLPPVMDDIDIDINVELDEVRRISRDISVDISTQVRDSVRDSVRNSVRDSIGRVLLAQREPRPPTPPREPREVFRYRGGSEESLYRRGAEQLDKGQWDEAVNAFSQVIELKGAKAEGAYYWKAYALAKLGRVNDASAAIVELQKTYPNGRWLNDARALQVEMKQAGGQAVSPERESDDDLKLMAINSLISSDPERAIPLLEKILKSQSSPKLKERALFVLAQSKNPKGREIVLQLAKGGANPDLQLKAVEYLGVYGKENLQPLVDIYSSTSDAAVKRAILNSFMRARDKDHLLDIAKNETNSDLRTQAIHGLGAFGAQAELQQMYAHELSVDVREDILHALMMNGTADKLIEIARSEKEPRLRKTAINMLGTKRKVDTADALVSIYGAEQDKAVKREILNALFIQGNAKAIIEVARKEQDVNLKRDAVQKLSMMKSKEATDFMMELLNK